MIGRSLQITCFAGSPEPTSVIIFHQSHSIPRKMYQILGSPFMIAEDKNGPMLITKL